VRAENLCHQVIFTNHASGAVAPEDVVDAAPPHSVYLVAEVASRCAQEWAEVADYLEMQVDQMALPAARGRPSGRSEAIPHLVRRPGSQSGSSS
jgi:hypothetical protein